MTPKSSTISPSPSGTGMPKPCHASRAAAQSPMIVAAMPRFQNAGSCVPRSARAAASRPSSYALAQFRRNLYASAASYHQTAARGWSGCRRTSRSSASPATGQSSASHAS